MILVILVTPGMILVRLVAPGEIRADPAAKHKT
jgi:hypothetical protein